MDKLLVVVGATGHQGSSVINAVLERVPGYKIRGITRDITTAASKALSDKGVQMVAADRYEVTAVTAAFKGATAIFVVTDYWQPLFNAIAHHAPDFDAAQKIAEQDEIEQGRKAVNAALDTCNNASHDNLEHFIFSSIPDADAISGGKYGSMRNYTGKIATVKYLQDLHAGSHGQQTLWAKTTLVWVGYYMENWINFPYSKPKKVGENAYVVRTTLPADAPITIAATADVGRYVAPLLSTTAATLPQHPVLASSERRTMAEMTAILASATGRNITYEQIPPEQFEEENPGVGLLLAKMFAYKAEYGLCGDVKTIGAKELGVKEEDLTSFESFVHARDWSFLFEEKLSVAVTMDQS